MKQFNGGLFFFVSKNMIAEKYVDYLNNLAQATISDQTTRLVEITIDGLDNSALATLWNTLNGVDTKPFFKEYSYYKHIDNNSIMQVGDINYSKQTVRCHSVYRIDRKNDTSESITLDAAEYMFWEEITKQQFDEWKKQNPSQENKAQTQYED